jgi:hypothetical protein
VLPLVSSLRAPEPHLLDGAIVRVIPALVRGGVERSAFGVQGEHRLATTTRLATFGRCASVLALPHHRHEWGVALHQLPPNSTTLPLSSSKAQCNDFPVVRFGPSPLRATPPAVPEHRPWRFATPFIPHRAGSPPADFTGDDYAEVFQWTWSPADAWPTPSSSPLALIQGSSSGSPCNNAAKTPQSGWLLLPTTP